MNGMTRFYLVLVTYILKTARSIQFQNMEKIKRNKMQYTFATMVAKESRNFMAKIY